MKIEMLILFLLLTEGLTINLSKQNLRIVWLGRDFQDHLTPPLYPDMGRHI